MSAYNDFIYGLGDFLSWTFQILPALGNIPNYLYAVLLFLGLIYWLRWQKALSAEAKQNGTIE